MFNTNCKTIISYIHPIKILASENRYVTTTTFGGHYDKKFGYNYYFIPMILKIFDYTYVGEKSTDNRSSSDRPK